MHRPLSDDEIAYLRKRKLVEGRKSSLYFAKSVARAINQEVEYTVMKGFDDQYYRDLIVKALNEHRQLRRTDINRLLLNKLPAALSDNQKNNKIDYLLKFLRKSGVVYVDENRYWRLTETRNNSVKIP